jgi:hypothetical protein
MAATESKPGRRSNRLWNTVKDPVQRVKEIGKTGLVHETVVLEIRRKYPRRIVQGLFGLRAHHTTGRSLSLIDIGYVLN